MTTEVFEMRSSKNPDRRLRVMVQLVTIVVLVSEQVTVGYVAADVYGIFDLVSDTVLLRCFHR